MSKNRNLVSNYSQPTSNFQNFLQKFIIAGIFIILFLPILGDYGDYLYPVGRELIFRSIIEILLIAYVFLVIIDRKYLPKISPLFIAIAAFWLISALANIFSLQPKLSFWGDFYRGMGFFTLTHFFVFFIILISVVKTWRIWKMLLYFTIAVSAVVVLIGIGQQLFYATGEGAMSTINNPNFFGAYLLLIFFLTLMLGYRQSNGHLRTLLYGLSALQIIATILTNSRGAMLGLFTGLVAILLLEKTLKKRKEAILSLGAVFIVLVGLIIGANVFHNQALSSFAEKIPAFGRIVRTFGTSDILSDRSRSWMLGIKGIADRPILGFGQENVNIPFDKYFEPGKYAYATLFPQEDWFDRAHNFIIDTGAQTGLLGLGAYAGIWITAFWLLLKRNAPMAESRTDDTRNFLRVGLIATFIAYFAQNLFNLDTVTSQIHLFLWFALAIFVTIPQVQSQINPGKPENQDPGSLRMKKYLLWISGIILIPAVFFSIINYHISFWKGAVAHNKTERLIALQQYDKAIELYEQAVNDNWSYLHHTLRHKYASALSAYAGQIRATNPEKAKENIKKALDLLDENVKSERYYFNRGWLLSGVIANALLKLDEPNAKERIDYYFGKALEMSPGRPGLWVEWAKSDMLTGNYEPAKKKLQKAADLNPKITEPSFYAGIIAIYENDQALALKYFDSGRELFIKNGYRGFNPEGSEALEEKAMVYYKLRDLDGLAQIYIKILQKNQNNVQLWVSLAVLYKENGQNEMARQTLEKAGKLFPGLLQDPKIAEFMKNL